MLRNIRELFGGSNAEFEEPSISEYSTEHLEALALESEDPNLRLSAATELTKREKSKPSKFEPIDDDNHWPSDEL